jgi:glycosyltransferase involved in cell wall biosynthesis
MKFSCIVPAFNEAARIENVVRTLLLCPDLHEIVVVDDCSTDATWEVLNRLEHPKLRKIRHEKNSGKTRAVFTGIRESSGEYVVTIDSDLLNLKPEHVRDLIAPIRLGTADVTLSIRENSLGIYKLLRNDFVSGERAVPRAVLAEEGYYLSGPGFGLEVKMNEKIIAAKYRVKSVRFPGVITPRKSDKYGFVAGTVADMKMVGEILSVLPAWRLGYQLWYFYRQNAYLNNFPTK